MFGNAIPGLRVLGLDASYLLPHSVLQLGNFYRDRRNRRRQIVLSALGGDSRDLGCNSRGSRSCLISKVGLSSNPCLPV